MTTNLPLGTCRAAAAIRCAGALMLCAAPSVVQAQVLETAYSFTSGQGGGVAVVATDASSGKISQQRVLFESSDCSALDKVRRADRPRMLLVTNLRSRGPHLFLASADGGAVRSVRLAGEPDELRTAGLHALVTCAGDAIELVDLQTATVAKTWQADRELDPPGRRPEDICVLPDLQHAVVSVQKDHQAGKKLGNRLVVLSLPELKRLADIPLERNHPDLHIEGNGQQQGPSPEVVLVSEPTNTLLATLDLYGGVALMDWTEAIAGRMSHWQYLSTALDQSWGTAFPDRAALVQDGTHALVLNAGPQGGAVLIDLAARQVVCRWQVPPGLEKPIYFPRQKLACSVCSGKVKFRGTSDVEKRLKPGRSVYVLQLAPRGEQHPVRMDVLEFDCFVTRIAAIGSGDRPLLLLAAGSRAETMDMLIVYDPVARQLLDQRPAAGTIVQFEG